MTVSDTYCLNFQEYIKNLNLFPRIYYNLVDYKKVL